MKQLWRDHPPPSPHTVCSVGPSLPLITNSRAGRGAPLPYTGSNQQVCTSARRDRTKRWLGVRATCPFAYFTWWLSFSSLRQKGKGEKEQLGVEKNFPCYGTVCLRGHSDLDVCNSGRAFTDAHIVRKRTGLMSWKFVPILTLSQNIKTFTFSWCKIGWRRLSIRQYLQTAWDPYKIKKIFYHHGDWECSWTLRAWVIFGHKTSKNKVKLACSRHGEKFPFHFASKGGR